MAMRDSTRQMREGEASMSVAQARGRSATSAVGLQAAIDGSPRMLAQRRVIAAMRPAAHGREAPVQRVGDVAQLLSIGDLFGFVQRLWSLSTWEGLADFINFLVKAVTTMTENKAFPMKALGLATACVASSLAAINAWNGNDRQKAVPHIVKAFDSLALIVVEYYGGSLVVNLIVQTLEYFSKNLPSIVAAWPGLQAHSQDNLV